MVFIGTQSSMKFIFALLSVKLQTAFDKIEREIRGTLFEFYAEGVIHWPDEKLIILSDLHIGKSTHFRKNGLPIGPEAFENDILKLTKIIDSLHVEKVLLLGDVFHSSSNWEHDVFYEFLKKRKESVILIAGNHDRHCLENERSESLPFDTIAQSMIIGPFLFSHEPTEHQNLFNICGHLHPAFRLKGKGRQSLKVRCFVLRKSQCILPAFGSLNGSMIIDTERIEDEMLLLIEGKIHAHRLRNSATNKTSPPISR